ncbi:MAG: tetratricopeptide repeat protein [Planctomycetota bacterium]
MSTVLSHFLKIPRPLLMILAMTGFVYGIHLSKEFVFWDDALYLMENPVYESESPLFSIWFAFETPSYYPLTFTFFYLQKIFFGWNAFGFHGVSLLLHLLNIVLFWLILKKISCSPRVCEFTTALYALHPVQTETVAWVAEQKNLLCAFFYWASFLYFIHFLEQSSKKRYYLGSLGCFLGAILSKSMAVTLPFSILWWTFIFHRKRWKWIAVQLLPFFLLAVLLSRMALKDEQNLLGKAQEMSSEKISLQQEHSFFNKLLYSVQSFWFYPYRLLCPFSLSPVYPKWLIEPNSLVFPILSLGILGVGLGVGFALKRGEKLLAFTLVNYGIIAGPILGLITTTYHNTSIVADRYQYHPAPFLMLGFVLFLEKFVTALPLKFWSCWFKESLYYCLLAGLMSLTWFQVQIWQNSLTLWTHAYRLFPNHFVILNNLGISYFHAGDFKNAERIFEQYTSLYPKTLQAQKKYGEILILQKKWKRAEEVLKKLIRQYPSLGASYYGLGQIYQYQQQWKQAEDFYQQALTAKKPEWKAFIALGFLALYQEQVADAEHCFNQARQAEIAPLLVHLGLGICYWEQPSLAETHFQFALHFSQNSIFFSGILSLWYWQKQAYSEAIQLILRELEKNPVEHRLRLQLVYFYLEMTPNQSISQAKTHFQKIPELWNEVFWIEANLRLLQNQIPDILSLFRLTEEQEDTGAFFKTQRNQYRAGILREERSKFNYKQWLYIYLTEAPENELK